MISPRFSLGLRLALVLCLGSLPCLSGAAAQMQEKIRRPAAQSEAEIRALLIGTWVGRKVVTYRKDGAWLLRRFEGAPPTIGKWSLKGNELTFVNPEAGTFMQKIESISKTKLVFAEKGQDREWDREK